MARKTITHERVDAMLGVSPSWLMRFVEAAFCQ
jgi:hypothetical protein